MSCFVVNDYHVNALVAWAVRQGLPLGAVSPDALAHELASANRAAFAERYQGRYLDELQPFEGLDLVDVSHLMPVAIVKACDCLDYQASDWTPWAESEACAHLAAIRAAALAMATGGRYPGPAASTHRRAGFGIESAHYLAGYDAAAWELSESETLGAAA
jgi:hypothetical protein